MAMGVYGFNMNIDTFIVGFFFLLCIEECSVKKKKSTDVSVHQSSYITDTWTIHSFIHSFTQLIHSFSHSAGCSPSLPSSLCGTYLLSKAGTTGSTALIDQHIPVTLFCGSWNTPAKKKKKKETPVEIIHVYVINLHYPFIVCSKAQLWWQNID